MLDTILNVWYGACTRSGPPRWRDMQKLILHPWMMHLVLVECRDPAQPARCAMLLPLAANLLGLPRDFSGEFPQGNPWTTRLGQLTRAVSRNRRFVFRTLPGRLRPDGLVSQPLVIGLPLGSTSPSVKSRRVEQVLFAVVNPEGE